MSKFDLEQHDMMHRVQKALITQHKAIQLEQYFHDVLKFFTTSEIIPTPFPGKAQLEAHVSISFKSFFICLLIYLNFIIDF